VISHPVGSAVKWVKDLVVGAAGRMLTAVELLPEVFIVSLSKDQLKFSDGTAKVEF
jgi:hypothetical protein